MQRIGVLALQEGQELQEELHQDTDADLPRLPQVLQRLGRIDTPGRVKLREQLLE